MPRTQRLASYRSWCFTWNNYDGLLAWKPEKMTYLVYQEEMGDSGTAHLQGFIVMKARADLVRVKRVLECEELHLEPMYGTAEQAARYCKKEPRLGGPYEYGSLDGVGRGERTDIKQLVRRTKEGATDMDLSEEMPEAHARFYRYVGHLRTQLPAPKRRSHTATHLLVGDAGTGKTRLALECFPDAYAKPHDGWWSGYTGQPVILLDDMAGWMQYTHWLRLCDPHGPVLQCEVKGGHVYIMASQVLITSNRHPFQWWPKTAIDTRAVGRRFKTVTWFKRNEEPIEYTDFERFTADYYGANPDNYIGPMDLVQ